MSQRAMSSPPDSMNSPFREATADPLITISQNWEQKKKTQQVGFELLSMYENKKKKKSELLPYFSRNITSHYRLAAGHYHTEPSQ